MRIIAGEFRRRLLAVPEGLITRPIPDRVKESFFSMLGTRVQGANVLDLFAGSGAIGLEAVSRGAKSCVFVERDKGVAAILQQNIDTFKAQQRCTVVNGDALGLAIAARAPRPLDLVFFDPPYPLIREAAGWDRVRHQATVLAALLAPDGFLIIRTPWPFLLEVPDPNAPPPEPERRGGKASRKARSNKPRKGGGRDDEPQVKRGKWDEATKVRHRKRRDAANADGGPRPLDLDGDEIHEELDLDELGLDPGALAEAVGDESGNAFDDDGAPDESEADDGVIVRTYGSAPEPGTPVPKTTPGDLTITGARGPETHAYGSTAVHWYMRA